MTTETREAADDLARPTAPSPRIGRALIAAGLVAGVLITARWIAPPTPALGDALQDLITLALSVVIESLPFVFLGIGLSIVVQLFVPADLLLRVLPKHPIPRRAALSLLGVLLPVCECGNVPLARGLIIRGVSVPDAMTFLLAAPILNPVTIITTYQAFGFTDGILAWRVIGGFVIANGIGWLFSLHHEPERLLTRRFAASCAPGAAPVAGKDRTRTALAMFAAETTAMLPALFVGAAVAGAIQVALSRDLLLTLGQNPVWSVLAMMGLAFVVAICSNVDAFFALSVSATFAPGAIVAFLVFGPMIDVKMLALLRTTFTARTLALLTVLVAAATLVLGLAVNLVG